jgi:oligosaccharide reducing-end xylanase
MRLPVQFAPILVLAACAESPGEACGTCRGDGGGSGEQASNSNFTTGGTPSVIGGAGGNSSGSGGSAVGTGGNAAGTGGSVASPSVTTCRNLFSERSHTDAEISAKLAKMWGSLFEGNDEQRVYYEVGEDEAYILDVANDDVRSEGVSYGMMVALQLDKKAAFDRLWTWASRYMLHDTGPRKGYFAWQCGKDGQKRDQNPASDGEAYFATALLFADARWGSSGAIDYGAQAQAILTTMLHKEDGGVIDSVTNMFNKAEVMVVFTPYASAALFTDPSYHLPAFYEVWAQATLNAEDAGFFSAAATTSRGFFGKTMHPTTGLSPDYALFDGTPTGAGHMEFRFDAWRVIGNLAVDAAWWGKNPDAALLAGRLLAFFEQEGIGSYGNQYELDGRKLSGDHSPGLVAMNALGALALPQGQADAFVDALWALEPPAGRYRYYDGMLYALAMLHASGQFKVYGPAASSSACH